MPLDQYIDALSVQIDAAYQRYVMLADLAEPDPIRTVKLKTLDRRRNQCVAAKAEWQALEARLQAIRLQQDALIDVGA